jgi:adenine phosphoribosyltransferase
VEPKTDFGTYISNYADFPTQGILFRDISPLLASQVGMTAAVDRFEESLSCYNIDMIAGIESRGFLFSTLLAMRLKVGSLMIRKPGKLPGDLAFKKYDLEYGSSELTLQKQAGLEERNVLIPFSGATRKRHCLCSCN